ncbi:hypothetical protein TNCV_1055361 [Trichonephila clavipes]|nr:hypothetical protein TNCV_1055361 [Trichonephila clavipes]
MGDFQFFQRTSSKVPDFNRKLNKKIPDPEFSTLSTLLPKKWEVRGSLMVMDRDGMSWVRALVPRKIRRVDRLMRVKSVEAERNLYE